MAIRFAGTEPEDFDATDDMAMGIVTGTSNFRSANSRLAMAFTPAAANTKYRDANFSGAATTELWLHAEISLTITTSSLKHFIRLKQGATDVIGLILNSATLGKLDVQKYDGGWSTVISSAGAEIGANVRFSLDINVKLGNPGTVKVYIDNAKVAASAALNLAIGGVTGLDNLRLEAARGSSGSYYMSEIIVADECTLGAKIVSRPPTGNGTHTAFTGTYTDYDDTAPDALYALGVANGDRESFTFAAFPALASGESIGLVKMSTNVNRDTGGPQNINHFVRRASTDYDKASQNPGVTATWLHDTWAVDPNTSAAWTIANLNAAEFGFRAVT